MKNHNKKRRGLVILYVIVLLSCVGPFAYLTVFRWVDYLICPHVLALKVGFEPTQQNINEYLQNKLLPGMHREEVEVMLSKIGKIVVWRGNTTYENIATDEIRLNMCLHPLNNITIFAHYSLNGDLVSFDIETGE